MPVDFLYRPFVVWFSIRFSPVWNIFTLCLGIFSLSFQEISGKKDILYCPCNKPKCFCRNTDYRNLGTRVLSRLHATKDRMSDINLYPVIALWWLYKDSKLRNSLRSHTVHLPPIWRASSYNRRYVRRALSRNHRNQGGFLISFHNVCVVSRTKSSTFLKVPSVRKSV